MAHKHREDDGTDRPTFGCVAPYACNPRAHGGKLRVSICRCGRERHTNVNGPHREHGRWTRTEE